MKEVDDNYKTLPFLNEAEFFKPEITNTPSNEEIAMAEEILTKRRKAKDEQYRNILLRCECGHSQKIKDSVYVQTYWYVTPSGCSGGDYWKQGEAQVPCDGCGGRMRLNFKCEQLQNSFFIQFFKEEKTYHERK